MQHASLTHPTLKHPHTGEPIQAIGVFRGRPVWPVMGASDDDPSNTGDKPPEGDKPVTFTQAELEAKIAERLGRERDQTREKYKDYDALKAAAEGAKTAEQKLADLTNEITATKLDALRSRVQASYGISDEDAELFLTGSDKETLEKQAKRLKEQADARSKNGGHVPGEGRNGRPVVSDEKTAVRTLFGSGSS